MPEVQRIVFAGTPDFAARPLQQLLDAGVRPVAVYTQPDRPAGRGRQASASPVKQTAVAAGLPVFQPPHFRDQTSLDELQALQPDLMIVVAYGLLLPTAVLTTPRLGCINVHASLLPRWRGAAPIQRALEAGDTESGVTLMQMDAGLDTGPMIAERRLPLPATMTGGELHDALAELGAQLLLETLPDIEQKLAAARPQPDTGVTYAHKLSKQEGQLDWQQSAQALANRVRAFNPWPVCWFEWQGKPVRVWSAQADSAEATRPGTVRRSDERLYIATGDGWLELLQVQPAGKKAMPVADWLRGSGQALQSGEVLT
ncbi:methionyl-tRNA formyltransferase [Natronospirillum operosum]|uniref:Methionyl-tRNA formyltransferase n=1 Tax=Natronospirillum operosum TaxID=2759953 RepID=A0A4Z0WCQ5_9GAMM|nr:methionyl-tRNA formyltransferase [Natronospirillum operosum]TGG91495.1 methionyl-tRNA formyltransferase [Natronospirillum operosum]